MNQEQKRFLEDYRTSQPKIDDIPILLERNDGDVVFLSDYACAQAQARKRFLTEAPAGLWLGGGAVMIGVPQGLVVIPDRRHGGNAGPSAQGWARYGEGGDLSKAARREFGEEVVVYTLAGEDDNLYQPCTEIVPAGVVPKGRVDVLNLELDEFREYGQIEFIGFCSNEKDRAFIYVGFWDLRGLERSHRLRVIWDDDFPGGRRPGTNPRVLDWRSRKEVGRFEGLQGYLPNDMQFHPVIDQGWEMLSRL